MIYDVYFKEKLKLNRFLFEIIFWFLNFFFLLVCIMFIILKPPCAFSATLL